MSRKAKKTAPKTRAETPARRPSMPIIKALPLSLTGLTRENEFAAWLRERKIQAIAVLVADIYERFFGKGLNALMVEELGTLRAAWGFRSQDDALAITQGAAAEMERRRRLRLGLWGLAEALDQGQPAAEARP